MKKVRLNLSELSIKSFQTGTGLKGGSDTIYTYPPPESIGLCWSALQTECCSNDCPTNHTEVRACMGKE